MAKVQVVDVEVLDNPSKFQQSFKFQITFDCLDNLRDDLEWKIIYVGSAENEEYDQTLDSVLVGPIPPGRHKFVFQADPPNPELIPVQDIVGVTVVIITCTYHGNEFVRVGYYVNNEYADLDLRENPPDKPQLDKLQRNILSSAPRVTRFKINWDDNQEAVPSPEQSNMEEGDQELENEEDNMDQGCDDSDDDILNLNMDSYSKEAIDINIDRKFSHKLDPINNSIDAFQAQLILEEHKKNSGK